MSVFLDRTEAPLPAAYLVASTHVTLITFSRATSCDADRVLVEAHELTTATRTLIHEGPVPSFDDVMSPIAERVAVAAASGYGPTLGLFDLLMFHQRARASIEQAFWEFSQTGSISTAAADFMDAYRTQWALDVLWQLKAVPREDAREVITRIAEEAAVFGQNHAEAIALRDLLKHVVTTWAPQQ